MVNLYPGLQQVFNSASDDYYAAVRRMKIGSEIAMIHHEYDSQISFLLTERLGLLKIKTFEDSIPFETWILGFLEPPSPKSKPKNSECAYVYPCSSENYPGLTCGVT